MLRHDEKKPGGVADVLAFFEGKGPEGENVSGPLVLSWCFTVDASAAHGLFTTQCYGYAVVLGVILFLECNAPTGVRYVLLAALCLI